MNKSVIEAIEQATDTLFSFEILPPLKGADIEALYSGIDPLMEFNPSFINVTYHREEYVYKKREKGFLEKISIRKRPGTVGICAAIKNKYGIITVPHLTCGGFSREETENALIDLSFLGINNILALRGDPIKSEARFIPNEDGHQYAIGLVDQVMKLNEGSYLDEDMHNKSKTNFCVGVAGYPEKHSEAMSMKSDLKHLKEKIDADAAYIVTQMFFDNQKYFEFVDRCRAIGIECPIIPGLKPLTSMRHIEFIPKTFGISFPEELSDQLENCTSNEEVRKIGVAWCLKQSQELKAAKVPCLHYYTMGKSDSVKEIVSKVF